MKRTTRRPRILLIVENIPFGLDHRVRKQTASLVAAGYQVSAISRHHPDNGWCPHTRIYGYPPPVDGRTRLGFVREYGYSLAMAAIGIARATLTGGFDAIQLCGPPDIYFGLTRPLRMLGKTVIVDQRDLSPEVYRARYDDRSSPMYRLLCMLEKASFHAAHHVITVNGSLRDIVCARGRLAADMVTVVGNGPALEQTYRRTPQPELKRGKKYMCCWQGIMGPQDRVDLAIRAVHHYVHVIGRKDCQFVFIGDGDARADCERLAASLGLAPWVNFPGFLPYGEVLKYMSTADLGMDSNLEEIVSPVKAMEYMACSLPFVAFDLKETRALADSSAAYVRPGDATGLAGLIEQLLLDPRRRREMGGIGRRMIEDKVAWDHQQAAYLNVFHRLLGAGSGAGTVARGSAS
jgi:glycosyltransferase involved in cell wall biosynthesis